MSKPTDDDINIAIAWLESNEGDPDGERGACVRVSVWLEQLVERREAKRLGVRVGYLRKLKNGTI